MNETDQEPQMPQNTKASKGGKDKPVKDTDPTGGKGTGKGSADNKSGSPAWRASTSFAALPYGASAG